MSAVYDVTRAAIQQSAYELGIEDRSDLTRVSAELVRLYEGNQMGYVWAYLAKLIKNERIRRKYQELAAFHNILRLLVDRVSTLGQLPVGVYWKSPDGSQWDDDAQALWDEIATERMGEKPWDALVPAVARRTELCKTCVAGVDWDGHNGEIDVRYWTPNNCDVGYAEGNERKTRPDRYYLLLEEATDWWQCWDFSDRSPGPSGVVYNTDRGQMRREAEAKPALILDPATGRSLVPFVTFRTHVASNEFFIWDGQEELLRSQEFVNRLYTQLSVAIHFGALKVPILSGSWRDEDGTDTKREITYDWTEALEEPADRLSPGNTGPKIRWDGPEVVGIIDGIIRAIHHEIATVAATFRISPKSVYSSNDPASGYSLQVENAALNGKHAATRTLARGRLKRLVELIRIVWDANNPRRRFPSGSYPVISIPNYGSFVTTEEETRSDIEKLKAGLVSRRTLCIKHNPGISNAELEKLVNAGEATAAAGAPVVPATAGDAGANAGDGMDTGVVAVAGVEKVQDVALNGAQMTALQAIAQSVADGLLPAEAAKAIVTLSIPSADPSIVLAMVEAAAKKATKPRPVVPAAGTQA